MQRSTSDDVELDLERSGDEPQERLDRLDEHIDDARHEPTAHREDADESENVAGDWEDSDDASGGDDPAALDDPEELDDDEES